jgi:hypothetical protein
LNRIRQAGEILKAERSGEAAELYLEEFLNQSIRQINGQLGLGPTFQSKLSQIPSEVTEALPNNCMAALRRMSELVPVQVKDPRSFAHALCVDGALVSGLTGYEEPRPSKPDAKKVFKRLASQHHPDKGGNPEVMAALNELYEAI